MIDTTFASDNPSHFRKDSLERTFKLIMKIIKDENLQYEINRKAVKISALSSAGKIDQYEYLAGEDILPSDQSRMIE